MSDLDDTRRRVLEAAGPLFADKGFDATGVREITDLAGTSPAAVNYHFRSKEDLYVATVRHAADSCARSVPLPDWPPGVPAEARLRDFVRAFLGRLLRPDVPQWHRVLIMREVAQPRPGICEELVRDFIRPTFEKLLGVLRDLAPAAVTPAQLRLLGGSVVGQCLHYHHARHVVRLLVGEQEFGGYDLDRLTDHITAFSLAAIRGLFTARAPRRAGSVSDRRGDASSASVSPPVADAPGSPATKGGRR